MEEVYQVPKQIKKIAARVDNGAKGGSGGSAQLNKRKEN